MGVEFSDTIFIDDPHVFPIPHEPASDPKYVKHVSCEGARFHVLHWDDNGSHCSEPKCIANKPPEEEK